MEKNMANNGHGDTFVGEFDNGIYTQGIYKWNNGNKYIGEFKSVFKNSYSIFVLKITSLHWRFFPK